ncbi:MAG: hypothetical protein ACOC5E_01415 [Acidobacteriota bacterium]
MRRRHVTLFAIALVVVLAAGAASQVLAETGCLRTYDDCAGCAHRMLRKAIIRLDLPGIREANFYLGDCVIELYHCVLLGSHTTLACPV